MGHLRISAWVKSLPLTDERGVGSMLGCRSWLPVDRDAIVEDGSIWC